VGGGADERHTTAHSGAPLRVNLSQSFRHINFYIFYHLSNQFKSRKLQRDYNYFLKLKHQMARAAVKKSKYNRIRCPAAAAEHPTLIPRGLLGPPPAHLPLCLPPRPHASRLQGTGYKLSGGGRELRFLKTFI